MTDLYELSPAGWALWKSVCVRGAGFPADAVLALASQDATAAIRRLIDVEVELQGLAAKAIAVVEADLGPEPRREDRSRRRALIGHLRKLRSGVAVEASDDLSEEATASVAAHRAAVEQSRQVRAEAAMLLGQDRERCVSALKSAAGEPRFREALTWQNRHALHTGVDALLRQSTTTSNAKSRGHERLVASHLQRYCLKNDSISFFGPIGWATIERGAPALVAKPGPDLLATRTVYFEHWAIDVLATSLAEDPALRRYLAPRRHPSMWIDDTVLHYPVDRQSELPLEFARVLAACDGTRSARSIALEVVQDPTLELSGEDEVYDLLEEMAGKKMVIWTLEVPPHVEHPEQYLAMLIEAVESPDAAARGLAAIAELRAARDAVATAAGDATALEHAMAGLDDAFTRNTGAAPSRRSGETYAGRTIVYEDCRRDLDITLGPALVDRIAPALSLLLTSARWYTYEVARRYREVLVEIHRGLASEMGSPSVDFLRFWERASEQFSGHSRKAPPLIAAVTQELQRRWAELFGLDETTRENRRHEVTLAQLARANEVFAAPHPGWPSARHHSPDLMIAARSIEAIARGEFMVIAGELHVAVATVAVPWTVRQHPDPAALVAALESDRPWASIEAVVGKERATRADRFSLSARDLDLEIGATRSWRPRAHVLEAGALVVEPHGDSLRLRSRGDDRTFILEQLLDSFLSTESASHFKLIPHAAHTPRVSVDNFVVSRETWRFEIADLDFLQVEDPLDRMLGVRRWAARHGVPRFVFYSIPEETKPCYLDLDSPHYVELFTHLARKASALTVSEMLPAIDELWLPDGDDRRYTSELRIVAVDPVAWPAP
ncbi:MAG: hypothetical protein JWP01_1945 [Myxococcales bacterium]|nr:hypothetical protein [Myxococcales bacterium]